MLRVDLCIKKMMIANVKKQDVCVVPASDTTANGLAWRTCVN